MIGLSVMELEQPRGITRSPHIEGTTVYRVGYTAVQYFISVQSTISLVLGYREGPYNVAPLPYRRGCHS